MNAPSETDADDASAMKKQVPKNFKNGSLTNPVEEKRKAFFFVKHIGT